MRYWARLMAMGVPVMVTWRSLVLSIWLPILIWAPDTCRISFILEPCLPMMEPISCEQDQTERNVVSFHSPWSSMKISLLAVMNQTCTTCRRRFGALVTERLFELDPRRLTQLCVCVCVLHQKYVSLCLFYFWLTGGSLFLKNWFTNVFILSDSNSITIKLKITVRKSEDWDQTTPGVTFSLK